MATKRTIAWALILGLSACRGPGPSVDAVAKVNGEAITRAAFDDLVERNLRRYNNQTSALPAGIRSRIEEGVLRRMVDDTMVQQRAHKEGVTVTEAELDTYLTQHKQRFRNPQAFNDYLARSDTTEAALREDLRKSLLRDRLVDKLTDPITVTDAEVEAYYKENLASFTEPKKMHVRRLLLREHQSKGRGKPNVARRARELYERAKRHPNDFAELCKKHSDGPEAEQGGSMGTMPAGRMAELDRLVSEGLGEGAISPITATAQGLEIYQVDRLVPQRVRSLADESASIREALALRRRNDRRQDVLRDLKKGAKVETLISFTPTKAQAAAGAVPTVQPPG
jgi:parvulin-like peptidyl-prolyl isomerase